MVHAIRIHKHGGPEVMEWEEVSSASPDRARRSSATPRSASISSTPISAAASIRRSFRAASAARRLASSRRWGRA